MDLTTMSSRNAAIFFGALVIVAVLIGVVIIAISLMGT